jgi:hypothetical protein
VPGEPATCILCFEKLGKSGSRDFGCRSCVDFTSCDGCFEVVRGINADNDTLNRCPCCKKDSDTFIPYPKSKHATQQVESCYQCTKPLGSVGGSDVTCPLCKICVLHSECWERKKRMNVRKGLPETQCLCCFTPVEMVPYEP